MEDGIKYNMAICEYLAAPGVRHGELSQAAQCLRLWKYWADNAQPDAGWQPFGQAFHYRVLEPGAFDFMCAVCPKFDRRTKEGKANALAWEDKNIGKIVISEDEFGQIQGMATAVEASYEAMKVLKGAKTEVSLFWTDKETGEQCKCRLDGYREDLGLIVELKGVRSCKRGFVNQMIDCGWHRQAAWQLQGLRALGKPAQHVVFIAVEKEAPYLLTVSEVDQAHLELAAQSNAAMLKRIHVAKEVREFPGYDNYIEVLQLPEWAVKQLEASL